MVKKLFDWCLDFIASNLNTLPKVGNNLATVHKELILDRIVKHDMLAPTYIPHVTQHLLTPAIKNINLYRCDQVDDNFLAKVGKSGCQLRSLTVHQCEKVTDAGISHVTRNQKDLHCLELRKLSKVTGKGLSELKSPVLHKLDLRGCSGISEQALEMTLTNNPCVKALILVGCNQIKDGIFPALSQILNSNLEELELEGMHTLSNSSIISLAEFCPKLKKLNIHGCNRVNDEGLDKLFTQCQGLRDLDLAYISSIARRPSAECLFKLPAKLTSLSLCGILLDEADLLVSIMCRLTYLKEIRLCGVTALSDDTLKQILSVIGEHLTHLDLSGSILSALSDDALKWVSKHCSSLEMLGVSMLRNVTGITLKPLIMDPERAATIKVINMTVQKLDPDLLYAVSTHCFNLEIIDVSGLTCMDDSVLYSLAQNCPNLHAIYMKGCKQVTDAGVCEVARCCPLRTLTLSGLRLVTDKSIFALANSCSYLETVYLNGCSNVSPVAVRYLLDCCVNRVYVQHRVPNADPNMLMAKNLDTGEFCRADLMNSQLPL